jgi:type I restriction enzyme S subunit
MKSKVTNLCLRIGSGGTPSRRKEEYYRGGTIKWLKTKELDDKVVYDTEESITELGLQNSSAKLFPKNTVTMAMYGATVGKLGILGDNMATNQACCNMVVDNNKADYRFLFYSLLNERDKLIGLANGAAQQNLNKNIIANYEINVFPLKEQKAIANILSTLDEKIETNNKINKKLEEMAQAIFKQWFVDFEFPNENGKPYKSSGGEMVESELGMIPKGWRVVKLKEIIEFIKNSTKPGEQLNNRKYVPIDTMPIKKLILNSYKSYKEAKSSLILFEKYDILIGAMRVYFHRVNLAPFRGVTRTTTFVLRSKSLEDISYNLLLLNMPSTISYADQSSIGSTIPYAVWEGGLGEMLLAQPPIEIRKKFNNVIFPLLEKMILNSQQNIRIQKIRDTLLPKLMSGEIRVPVEEEK